MLLFSTIMLLCIPLTHILVFVPGKFWLKITSVLLSVISITVLLINTLKLIEIEKEFNIMMEDKKYEIHLINLYNIINTDG